MRGLAPIAILLLAASVMAGCSQPQAQPAAEPADAGSDRTAREGRGSGDAEEGVEMRSVEILHTPLQMAGQGPVSFDVEVPADVDSVGFTFAGGTTFDAAGLRVELSGCGSYDNGMGFMGSTGGTYNGGLCGAAEPGAQAVTVSGTLVVFDGTFVVTAYIPANFTASASAAAT